MTTKTHIASDETLKEVAAAIREVAVRNGTLTKDPSTGRYDNQQLKALLSAAGNGMAYGVSIPTGATVACTKTGANAGVANPVPGVIGTASVDPYRGVGPFVFFEVNGGVDSDGTPYVTAIEGDGSFARDGSNGDVWVMAPVLWWGWSEGTDAIELTVCDSQRDGLSVQPGGLLPSGAQRPYMLYAKYAMSNKGSNTPQSASGYPIWNRNISHNTLITYCGNASSGYSGRSIADDWYLKVMFFLKYATKNSQSVFGGCTSYDVHCLVTVAQATAKSVIVSNADAARILVGSSVMVGSSNASSDRNASTCYDLTDAVRVLSKTVYDSDNTRLNLDMATGITTTTASYVSTAPWHTGCCDMVEGDGSPYSCTSAKEPYVLQGIECSMGCYEVFGDVMAKNSDGTAWLLYVNYDSQAEATAVGSGYTQVATLPADTTEDWHYPYRPTSAGGLLFGADSGASTTTGLCDGLYLNKLSTTGEQEVAGFGNLSNGALSGLWVANCHVAPFHSSWNFGARLSATGRTRG